MLGRTIAPGRVPLMKYASGVIGLLFVLVLSSYDVLIEEGLLKVPPPVPVAANVDPLPMLRLCAHMEAYRQDMHHLHLTGYFLDSVAGELATEILTVQQSQPVHCDGWTKVQEDAIISNAFSRAPLAVSAFEQKNKVANK